MIRVPPPFRHSKFRLVWAGQFANVAGDGVFPVAIALFLLTRHDAARALGLVLAMDSLGTIFSLLYGGVLADRHRRTFVLVSSDAVRAAGLLGIILLGASAPLWALAACSCVVGIGTGLYRPASAALLPSLVPADIVPQANAARELTNSVAGVIGAAFAGVLVAATSPTTTLWLDMATFLVSTVTLLGVKEGRPVAVAENASVVREIMSGVRYVFKRAWMAAVMIQGTIYVAFVTGPITILLPLVIGDRRQVWYGLVVAADAAGAFVGISIGAAIKPRLPGRAAMLATLLPLPELVCIAFDAPPWALLVCSALAGVGLAMFGVIWTTTLQTRVDPALLGRVFALDAFASTGFAPVGLALAGLVISLTAPVYVAWTAAAILVLSVFVPLAFVPGIAAFADASPPVEHSVS
jgi:MFS family permease